MDSLKPVVLLTRPDLQAKAFRRLLGAGAEVIESPVLEIHLIPIDVELKKYSALIFPSQNAVRSAAASLDPKGLNAFAVGDKTASAARELGMHAISAAGNSEDLVSLVIKAKPEGKILLIRGRHSIGNVEEKLRNAGIDTDSIVAYEQEPLPLSDKAKAALYEDRPVVIPLFSPRSAAIVGTEIRHLQVRAPLILVGISNAVLKVWDGPVPIRVVAASHPTADSVAKEILRLNH